MSAAGSRPERRGSKRPSRKRVDTVTCVYGSSIYPYKYIVAPVTRLSDARSPLGESQIGAVVFLVAVPQEIEEAGIRRHEDAGGAGLGGCFEDVPPVLPATRRSDASPQLERCGEAISLGLAPRLLERGVTLRTTRPGLRTAPGFVRADQLVLDHPRPEDARQLIEGHAVLRPGDVRREG